jgi:hypothetical protein
MLTARAEGFGGRFSPSGISAVEIQRPADLEKFEVEMNRLNNVSGGDLLDSRVYIMIPDRS